jgi:hypothetical protein
MTPRDETPNVGREGAPTANPWTLPKLRIDLDGDWYDGDVQVTHEGILANLRAGLKRDAEGYFIQTRVRIPVEVADAPFIVMRFERRDDELVAHLNDGTQEVVDPATLRVGPGDVPYGAVKGGRFEARFSRAAAYQLWGLAEHEETNGRSVLRLGGREYSLRRSR